MEIPSSASTAAIPMPIKTRERVDFISIRTGRRPFHHVLLHSRIILANKPVYAIGAGLTCFTRNPTLAAMTACAHFALLALSAGTLQAAEFHGLPYSGDDLFADTWVAVDGAGRVSPGFNECGPPKSDKWVGIFYWTWHTKSRTGP